MAPVEPVKAGMPVHAAVQGSPVRHGMRRHDAMSVDRVPAAPSLGSRGGRIDCWQDEKAARGREGPSGDRSHGDNS
jgi:hypothetical protein